MPDVVMTPAGGAGLTAPITNVLDLLFCSVFLYFVLFNVCLCLSVCLYTVQFYVMLSCLILSSFLLILKKKCITHGYKNVYE